MPDPLKSLRAMTRSPTNCSSTVSSTDCLMEAPNTVNSVTTATPTISAEAVLAVRRGLRMAFWRASLPLMARRRASGAPSTAAAGRATIGPSRMKPGQRGDGARARLRGRVAGRAGPHDDAAGAASTTAPATARQREERRPVDRHVAQGGERGDPRGPQGGGDAGGHGDDEAHEQAGDDRRGRDHQRHRHEAEGRLGDGSAGPGPGRCRRAMPIAEATKPTTSASTTTEVTTWRRDAPSARNRADSRVRWATRIEKVL